MSRSPRPFAFSASVREEAFRRQWNHCALCGEDLSYLWDNAHHVVPNQSGDPLRSKDAFLRTAENCVVLCDVCHPEAHGGNFVTGAVRPPAEFAFSHGTNRAAHAQWARALEAKIVRHYATKPRSPG